MDHDLAERVVAAPDGQLVDVGEDQLARRTERQASPFNPKTSRTFSENGEKS